jgi:flagellar biogenesis protein FliO
MTDLSAIAAAPQEAGGGRRKAQWALLLLALVVALAFVFIPAWLMQPFRAQTARGVELSYWLKSWSPLVTAAATLVALALVYKLWRARRGVWRKAALLLALVVIGAAAWFAQRNHFEWMFKPISSIAYAKANEATFVDGKDMVLAIEINGDAVAYPVRQLAYHHVVNDVVGGRPVTATY